MSKEQKPYTDAQLKKLEKYIKSKKGQEAIRNSIKKINEESEIIIDGMKFTWDEWNKIKDVPFSNNL